jgi:hypothetical protein
VTTLHEVGLDVDAAAAAAGAEVAAPVDDGPAAAADPLADGADPDEPHPATSTAAAATAADIAAAPALRSGHQEILMTTSVLLIPDAELHHLIPGNVGSVRYKPVTG